MENAMFGRRITSVVLLMSLLISPGCSSTRPNGAPDHNAADRPEPALFSQPNQAGLLSFPKAACVPAREGTQLAGTGLTLGKTNPPSGSSVSQSEVLNISLSYSVETRSVAQYKLTAMVDATSPDKTYS